MSLHFPSESLTLRSAVHQPYTSCHAVKGTFWNHLQHSSSEGSVRRPHDPWPAFMPSDPPHVLGAPSGDTSHTCCTAHIHAALQPVAAGCSFTFHGLGRFGADHARYLMYRDNMADAEPGARRRTTVQADSSDEPYISSAQVVGIASRSSSQRVEHHSSETNLTQACIRMHTRRCQEPPMQSRLFILVSAHFLERFTPRRGGVEGVSGSCGNPDVRWSCTLPRPDWSYC